ncbi:unnamed protein product [Adineta steineri]|uniref:Uncharacterized protein n=1 Tax=Adineta steineri TaxID=433720 RepID=A0A814R2A3_9BILA|nr:unnamed protein product [Adineta steineri]CAF1469034.1 unnamed protein product [Adineta steineri]CAF1469563.1 unnamed protein product [Adineta steineri]
MFNARNYSDMFSSNNNKPQAIIDLNKILYLTDWIEIKRMETEFITNGWCFVLLPTELIPDLKLGNELSNFFESNDRKTKYSQILPIYGYSKVNHKEGIKLLTGSYFGDFAYKGLVPAMLVKPLNYLSQVLDTITKRLIEILDQHLIFQQKSSLSSLIKHADLPLEDEHFGMLDIVSYFNDKSDDEPMDIGTVTFENLPESASITVLPGEKKLDFLKRVEMATGLSTSKMGPVRYQLEKHVISYPTTSCQIKKTSYYSI